MPIEWIETLEQRVREAAEEIRRLRGENEQLQDRTATLERELAQVATPAASASAADAEWEEERAEVRARVERLVRQLEGLIQEAEVGDG
jgi:chromosome segregation ATPase